MLKYYTRACNFIYGNLAKKKIKSGQALPLCGNNLIAFSSVEIFIRNKNKVITKVINIQKIESLNPKLKIKIKKDIKIITSKRKSFLKNINFSNYQSNFPSVCPQGPFWYGNNCDFLNY